MAKKQPTVAESVASQGAEPVQTPTPSKAKITPLKKLTVKGICGKPLVKDIPEGGELLLCRIAGTAHATQKGESNFGPWEALIGEFAATNYETGEMFVGKSAFIPGAMGEALIGGLDSAQKDDATATMRFSVDISIAVSSSDENKYVYFVRPVIESDIGNQAVALLNFNAAG